MVVESFFSKLYRIKELRVDFRLDFKLMLFKTFTACRFESH